MPATIQVVAVLDEGRCHVARRAEGHLTQNAVPRPQRISVLRTPAIGSEASSSPHVPIQTGSRDRDEGETATLQCLAADRSSSILHCPGLSTGPGHAIDHLRAGRHRGKPTRLNIGRGVCVGGIVPPSIRRSQNYLLLRRREYRDGHGDRPLRKGRSTISQGIVRFRPRHRQRCAFAWELFGAVPPDVSRRWAPHP